MTPWLRANWLSLRFSKRKNVASPAVRWTILSSLLVATLVGVFYPVDESPAERPARGSRVSKAAIVSVAAIQPTGQGEERANVDPFAPRGWQAQPVTAPVPVVLAVPEFVGPMRPPPPPRAPALPFQYMGRFTDGGPTVVYLSRGDQTLIARAGETLESIYKILEITPVKIDFLHVPTGEKQSLNIPATSN
jgi:hypothetical protein